MKNTIQKELVLLTISGTFAIVLMAFRIGYTGSWLYTFLIWNLFLAGLPWVFSKMALSTKSRILKVGYYALWLLFLPNAPYVLTDLFHIKHSTAMPIWYDLMLVLAFAWTSLLSGIFSLRSVESQIRKSFGKYYAFAMTSTVMFLCSFGIYLGRFLRWNSWDILQQPGALAFDILHRFIHPFQHTRTWGVTVIMGVFLVIVYYSVDQLRNKREEF